MIEDMAQPFLYIKNSSNKFQKKIPRYCFWVTVQGFGPVDKPATADLRPAETLKYYVSTFSFNVQDN
jgi:hypothetical protein